MRRYVLLLVVALAVVVTGCGGEASPTASSTAAPEAVEGTVAPSTDSDPTVAPPPTQAGGASEDSPASSAPSGEAVCEAAAAEFPVQPGLPPVTEEDHVRGGDDASITLIEYSDFQ